MKLHLVYSADIRAECLAELAKPGDERHHQWARKGAQAVIAFLDAIEPLAGPEKWLRFHHGEILSFFAFDPTQFVRQSAQVEVYCRLRYSEVHYLLPHEHRPWQLANAYARDILEAAQLVLDAFTRCEHRREYLVRNV